MIFEIEGDKFVLDSFRLYKLYRYLGWYLKKETPIDIKKLMHSVYNCPPVIENTPQGIALVSFFDNLFKSLKHKNYTIYDIIIGLSQEILPFRKKNEKKNALFKFSYYNIDKTKRIMSEEQGNVDRTTLLKYTQELKKPLESFCDIRSSGTNIFYELIKNGYISEKSVLFFILFSKR